MKSAKRDSDNGHPCLVPRFKLNGLDICPLVITHAVGVLYFNPGQFTLINAFFASRVRIMAGSLVLESDLLLAK